MELENREASTTLKYRRPDIFAQINHELTAEHCANIDLETISYGSNKKLWWNCLNDPQHVWEAGIKHRAGAGTACPYCAGNKVMAGNNDLATLNPDVARQWHPIKNGDLLPNHVTVASTKKVWWLCEVDARHEWETAVKTRNRGRGCPVCSSHLLVVGINDFATAHPELVSEWNHELNYPLTPDRVARSANRKVWWTCPKDERHVYQSSINARDVHNYGCSVCSGKTVIAGVNDAATSYPELLKEWHPTKNGKLKFTDVSPMSHRAVWWVCKKNFKHSWKTTISSRTALGSGCQVCNSRLFVPGLNDLTTDNPTVASQWHSSLNSGVTPDTVIRYSKDKYWWQCPKDKNHVWEASVVSRNKLATGCPHCIFWKNESEFRDLFNEMVDLDFIDTKIPVKWNIVSFTQIDIFNEKNKICIEFDGLWSHGGAPNSPLSQKESLDRDVRKTKALLIAGYTVVRIRVEGLPDLPIADDKFFQINWKMRKDKEPIVLRCIEFLEDILNSEKGKTKTIEN